MLVHRCDRCCVYLKEIQPCRAKYRGIWAILIHKMMFPSESCKGTFREFRPFSLSRKCSPCVPPEPLRKPLGVHVPQFGNRGTIALCPFSSSGVRYYILKRPCTSHSQHLV